MQAEKLEWHFTLSRGLGDRRITTAISPPYLTEEGLTLVERREGDDRRVLKNMVDSYSTEKFNFYTTMLTRSEN